MSILQIIGSRNYIVLNKHLIKLLGFVEAGLLGELASEHNYWLEQGKLQDGWFYSTVENIENNLGLSKYEQSKALKKLQAMGFVDFKLKGLPARRYIRIYEENLEKALNNQVEKDLTHKDTPDPNLEKPHNGQKSKIFTSGGQKFLHLEVKNFDPNNNNIINNNINNISFPPSKKNHENSQPTRSKDLEKRSPNKFKLAPPESLEEVQAYFQYEELETDPIKFFFYYEGRGWKGINNWQIAAKAWTDIGYNQNRKRHKNKYQENNIYNSLSSEDLDKL